jgi:DNA repair exonuclease SbcCD ATPase subunit
MKIKKIQWRNIKSYGNVIQTIDLDQVKPELYQVYGENGTGKSGIADVITFALYGKLEGKKQKDIPNRFNRNAWCSIVFETGGKEYEIERGLEPAVFELKVNGVPFDKAGKATVQDYISEEVLQIPYGVFINTISLSINDFKSFVKMSPDDKRAIIDKIFGFHIINKMRELVRDEARSTKARVDAIESELRGIFSSISSSETEIERIRQKIGEDQEKELETYAGNLEKLKKALETGKEKMSQLLAIESELKNKSRELTRGISDKNAEIRRLAEKIDLYNREKCPTCATDFKTPHFQELSEKITKEKALLIEALNELTGVTKEVTEKEKEVAAKKISLTSKCNEIEGNSRYILSEISRIKKDRETQKEVSSIMEVVNKLREESDKKFSDKKREISRAEWIKSLEEILSEKGVKQLAIKSVLPVLNSTIAELLLKMNIPYSLEFDTGFNAILSHLGEEISPTTLSAGESKKVDFAVLIAVLKMMKMKFSNVNLVFLDEIFSSIDPNGIYAIMHILKKFSAEAGVNVFVINHVQMPGEMFDKKIETSKKTGFSEISIFQA